MSINYRGFVARIGEKSGKVKRPPYRAYTLYSVKIEKEDGSEYDDWVGFGFERPPFSEGDFVEFQAEKNPAGYLNVVEGSGSLVKNPPARAAAKGKGAKGADNSGGGSTEPAAGGADRQTSIVLQHSQEMAIAFATLLHGLDALPVSSAQTKAGEAKRFGEVTAIVDKLTVKFYNDAVTGRILTTVADTVTSTAADGPIPGADSGKDADKFE